LKKINYLLVIAVTLIVQELPAQLATHYTQFLLNEYGTNPAVSGSNSGLNFLVGRRTQWVGFESAPETNFASFCKDLGKKGYTYYWHGIGGYIENDKFGVFTSQMISVSYAMHFKLPKGMFFSMGLAGGVKNVALSNLVFNGNDPALQQRSPDVWLPTFMPGVYLYSKRTSIGIGVKDLYKSSLKQKDMQIGSHSKLPPTAYITLSRKYRSYEYDYTYVPAVQIQTSFAGLPSVSLNFMALYRGRVGMGISYRSQDAFSAVLQVRVLKNVIIGLAYDYSISRIRSANANSLEGMLGFSPLDVNDNEYDIIQSSKCPSFEF
jgi:type IX secretion system PorP/SprF family membrane protein